MAILKEITWQGMSNASEIKKPNYQRQTEIKVEQIQVSLLGKTINCLLFHCNDSAGGARGQFVHRLIVAGT